MGGTDADDQMLSYYRPRVKTISHAPRIFVHLLSSSLVNAYIIFVERNNLRRGHYRYLDFLNAIIDQWSKPWLDRLIRGEAQLLHQPRPRRRSAWSQDRSRLHGRHDPIITHEPTLEHRGQHYIPTNRNLLRGNCLVCTTRTNTKCSQCGVWLCCRRTVLQVEINDPNCWVKFHTWPNLNIDPDLDDNDNLEIEI